MKMKKDERSTQLDALLDITHELYKTAYDLYMTDKHSTLTDEIIQDKLEDFSFTTFLCNYAENSEENEKMTAVSEESICNTFNEFKKVACDLLEKFKTE